MQYNIINKSGGHSMNELISIIVPCFNEQEALPSKNTALMISTNYGRIVSSSPDRLLLPCILVIFLLGSWESISFLWLTFFLKTLSDKKEKKIKT